MLTYISYVEFIIGLRQVMRLSGTGGVSGRTPALAGGAPGGRVGTESVPVLFKEVTKMGNLVDDMQSLSDDVIGSYIDRKHCLDELKKEVNEMLVHFEVERLKMSNELQARLAAFLLDLEKRVRVEVG